MNRESNIYTLVYATVMVAVVAVALALTSVALKQPQEANMRIDKMQQILRSLHLSPSKAEVIQTYQATIQEELLVNSQGEVVQRFSGDQIADNDAFRMNTANQFKLRKSDPSLLLPLYVAEIQGERFYVFPMDGAGLWGPIWGYLAVYADGSKVYGADFSHAGETPGLGAEIATPHFRASFEGKQLYRDNHFTGIAVVKPGQVREEQDYVDGISGGTLTSAGVNEMLLSSIKEYAPFIDRNIRNNTTTISFQ